MARGYRCDRCGTFIEGNADAAVQKYLVYKRGNVKTVKMIHVADFCVDCSTLDIAEEGQAHD